MRQQDAVSGLFFIAVALIYGAMTLRSLPVGSALNMGPGYFPAILCGVLLLLGGATLIGSFGERQALNLAGIPWRAIAMISFATVLFGRFLPVLGLFPGVLVAAFFASYSNKNITILQAVLIGGAVAAFCAAVFGLGVGLTVPLFGPWFRWGIS